jgi:site-specific recombinase XerC
VRQGRFRPFKPLLRLGLSTGMRRNKILQLEWSRVRLRPALDLSRSGRSEGQNVDAIPLNATALREWLDFHRRHAPKATYVFIDRFGARIASIKITFYAVAEQAGLPGISPHTLWHAFAVWPVQASVPLRTVCELCRDKDIRTTMRYAHLASENGRAAIEPLDTISQESVRPDAKRA